MHIWLKQNINGITFFLGKSDKIMDTDKTPVIHSKDKINHLTNRVNKFQEIVNKVGAPPSGSRTDLAHHGQEVQEKILEEMKHLCHVFQTNGKEGDDDTITITFTDLFKIYTNVSDKLVGVLLKARKQGYSTFKGEMLLQNRDENAPIQLIHSPS
ncbi:unnamed protein product [Rotaria magnacalcarata]|uniref:Costars domain-containing protein n=2 Tax=Rotaria magnacalcarata TaxID=392030 RepID=A0A816WBY1_9BILA|nr:unnamed protein product [Rotaria magnacalcarata]CAF4021892.1 unnamed protein product [Rotaria magnacalcarata]CAF4170009.1 unnamed protein product [Rotaria magnacalcarata]